MKQQTSLHGFKQKTIVSLVVMALPVLIQISVAEAACTTSSTTNDPNLVTCTEGSTYTNPANTTVTNSAEIQTSVSTSSVVKMDGNGNSFTNNGTIANNATYLNSLSANAGQKYGVYIGSGTGTNESLVNQMINNGSISAVIDIANTSNKARLNTTAVVGLGTDVPGEYELNNTGTITATHNGVGRVNGVEAGGDVEEMTITNEGTIRGTASSVITKTTSTAASFQGTVSGGPAAANIGVAAGIYVEEEVESLTVENSENGLIEGVGTYASGIYTRSKSVITNEGTITGKDTTGNNTIGIAQVSDSGTTRKMTLDNSGTINGDVLSVNGVALRWWSLSKGEGTGGNTLDSRLLINSQWGQADSNITNSGNINGSLYYSNGTHKLTNQKGATITGNIDLDQRDTTFATATTCNFGDTDNGCWANRPTVSTAAQVGSESMGVNVKVIVSGVTTTGGTNGFNDGVITYLPTVVGTKTFTFENAGTFNGDLTIRTASGTLANNTQVVSKIELIPTIIGIGAGSANTASATGIAGMGNTLNVITTAGGDIDDITIKPKIASGVTVVDGQFYKLANTFQINSANVAANATTLPTVKASNSLISWTASVNSSNALVLESEVNNATSVAGVSGNSANALNTLVSANNPLFSTIANLDSDAKVAQAAQSLLPEVNGASVNAAQQATGASMQIINNRNSAAQTAVIAGLSNQRGVSTGDQGYNTGVWAQGVGFTAEQDRRKQTDGYNVNAYGMALGVDRVVNTDNNLRVGGAFTYTNTNVDASGANKGDRVGVDSYLGTLYASANMGDWYLNGAVLAGQHKYDTKRLVVGNSVKGSYDANQYGINVDAGMPIKTGLATLIPVVSAAYHYLDLDGYTERGTGSLKISSDNINSFRTGLGARALLPVLNQKSYVEVRGIWYHEYADNRFDTTARFTTGGSSFKTSGVAQARDSANFGASLKLTGDAGKLQQSLLLTYDGEVKDQYLSHTGSVQVRFDF